MMSAKMATLVSLKIKLFWNNSYDDIISDHYHANNILSCVTYYIVGEVMRPKFGNFSISMYFKYFSISIL